MRKMIYMPPEIKKQLVFHENGLVLYRAGFPEYSHDFTRDSMHAGNISQDPKMLKDQLQFNALTQGKVCNPLNGAEPGKAHHQLPGVMIRGLSTEYNACDTTAWCLIGYEEYLRLTGDQNFIDDHKDSIVAGVNYILNHLNSDYLFEESPKFAGADKFALKVTYWKDSQLPQRREGEPKYPVVYTLAHIQNMAGIRISARLLHSNDLLSVASKMVGSLDRLFDEGLGTFVVAVDQQGPVRVVSSDALTALFFLEPGDVSVERLSRMIQISKILETPLGYRVLSEEAAKDMEDKYHADTIWPLEQATINIGARKHRVWAEEMGLDELTKELVHVEEVSARVKDYLAGHNYETFILKNGSYERNGCDPHLMTVAAKAYFHPNYSFQKAA